MLGLNVVITPIPLLVLMFRWSIALHQLYMQNLHNSYTEKICKQ